MLICVLVGFALARPDQPFDHKMVGRLVANIGYPTLVLAHLSDQHGAVGAFSKRSDRCLCKADIVAPRLYN